jgi:hypothetical protein
LEIDLLANFILGSLLQVAFFKRRGLSRIEHLYQGLVRRRRRSTTFLPNRQAGDFHVKGLYIACELGLQGFNAFIYTFTAYLFDYTLIALLHSLLHLIRRGFKGD